MLTTHIILEIKIVVSNKNIMNTIQVIKHSHLCHAPLNINCTVLYNFK